MSKEPEYSCTLENDVAVFVVAWPAVPEAPAELGGFQYASLVYWVKLDDSIPEALRWARIILICECLRRSLFSAFISLDELQDQKLSHITGL